MSLFSIDIDDNNISLETNESLAHRIDFAWFIYNGKDTFDSQLRNKALKFLVAAFNLEKADRQKVPQLLQYLILKMEKNNPHHFELLSGNTEEKTLRQIPAGSLIASCGIFKTGSKRASDNDPAPLDSLQETKSLT